MRLPVRCTRRWAPVPPPPRAVQCDEKWACVGTKEQPGAPEALAAAEQGDTWDPVALGPEHRLGVSVVPGTRPADTGEKLVHDCKTRSGARPMTRMTSADYPAYKPALLKAEGQEGVPPRTGNPGRPKAPYKVAPPELQDATVPKTRAKGRGVKVDFRVVFGTVVGVRAARAQSRVSKAITTACIERQNGTARTRHARKVRKSYCFSKNWERPEAVTDFTLSSYTFCWSVRTLRVRDADGRWRQRTPAMAAGLAEHIWTLAEWLTFPGVQRK